MFSRRVLLIAVACGATMLIGLRFFATQPEPAEQEAEEHSDYRNEVAAPPSPRQATEVDAAPEDSEETEPNEELESAVHSLKAAKANPIQLLAKTRNELAKLEPEQLDERTVLIREASLAFEKEVSPELVSFLAEERRWLRDSSDQIRDPAALRSYLNELTRVSLAQCEPGDACRSLIKQMADDFGSDERNVNAFDAALRMNAAWYFR